MLNFAPQVSIYLATGVTDLRKSFHSLAAIVVNELERDPLSGEIFAFANRRRDRVRILFFDGSGLWVCAKKLERGTFAWPEAGTKTVKLRAEELTLLLAGIDLRDTEPRRWYGRKQHA